MKNDPYVLIGWYDQPSVLPGWTKDCPDWSIRPWKINPYVLIGWYDQPSVLPGRTKDCLDWSIRPWKIDPNVLIGWYDQPYPYWMEGFISMDHGVSGLVPSIHEKVPICTDSLIRSAIHTAWKGQGLSRLVHRAMKKRPIRTDSLMWSALSVLNGSI